MAAFTRRMRRTASSMRDIGTSFFSARSFRLAKNSRYFSGTIAMSMPALIDCLIWLRKSPGS